MTDVAAHPDVVCAFFEMLNQVASNATPEVGHPLIVFPYVGIAVRSAEYGAVAGPIFFLGSYFAQFRGCVT